jgi:replicative DNA helicase
MNNQFKNQIQELISSHNLDDKDLLFNLKKLIRNKEFEGYTYDESLSFQELFESNKKIIFNEVENFNLIKTNFPTIDEEIGGFNKGELIVIGGRPSMGKTQFLISFLLNVAKTNPILYFTFDISKELLVNRILSSYTEISINKVLQLNLSQDEKERISSASEELNQLKLYINDSCQNVFHGFREQCKKHVEEHGVQLIFVDYLQMMVTNRHRFNREQEISTIVRELKNIAKELNVVIITTSQLSRSVEQS